MSKTTEQEKEIQRLERWVIIPALLFSLIGLIVTLEFRSAFGIYLALNLFTWTIMRDKKVRAKMVGIKRKKFLINAFIGLAFFIGFIAVNYVAPAFSLALPPGLSPYAIPALLLSIGGFINFFIIVWLASGSEEPWRTSVLGLLVGKYKMNFWFANIIQSVIFSFIHLLAIGISLGVLENFSELVGAVNAQSGFFIGAFSFALISGYLMNRTKSVVPSGVSHIGINWFLWVKIFKKFVIVS